MDQLVNLVVEKTGIPQEAASKAVEVVMGFLKDKLPPPVAAQLDGVLSGQGAGGVAGQAQQQAQQGAGGLMDQAKGMLGGMFGGNKE